MKRRTADGSRPTIAGGWDSISMAVIVLPSQWNCVESADCAAGRGGETRPADHEYVRRALSTPFGTSSCTAYVGATRPGLGVPQLSAVNAVDVKQSGAPCAAPLAHTFNRSSTEPP